MEPTSNTVRTPFDFQLVFLCKLVLLWGHLGWHFVFSYESLQKTKLLMMEMITRHIISLALHRSKLKFKLAANIASRREQLASFLPPRVLVKQSHAKAQGVHHCCAFLFLWPPLLKQLIAGNSDAVAFVDPEAGSAPCGPAWIHLWFCPRRIAACSVWANWGKKIGWNSPIFSHDSHLL